MPTPDAATLERVLGRAEAGDDPGLALTVADAALEVGDARLAASALDRAYGLAPQDERVAKLRREVLDSLTVREHGLVFRYVPAGSFLMGSSAPDADADERPVHAVRSGEYWLTDIPVTWADYARLLGWSAPPQAQPPGDVPFSLYEENKVRFSYAKPPHDRLPMVAVSHQSAEELALALTSLGPALYGLPTEAQWEKAARGGLIGKRYAWGDEPPDEARCDSNHFGKFELRAPRSLPANGYGLHGMCGGVWEWTADDYDALAYAPERPPTPPQQARERVLRGGSFTDCDAALRVSFRMARGSSSWRVDNWGDHEAPNIGFRLCRLSLS